MKTIYSYVQRGLIPYVRIQSNLRFVKADVLGVGCGAQFGSPKSQAAIG